MATEEQLNTVKELDALQERIGAKHAQRIQEVIEEAIKSVAEGVRIGGQVNVPLDHAAKVNAAITDLYREITRETAAMLIERVKSGFTWLEAKADEDEFYQRLLQEYMERYGFTKISQISATTRAQIRRIVGQGLKDGQSLIEIADNLIEAAPTIGGNRALVISRTETHSASMFASLESAKRSTVPLMKEWVSTEDLRTRDHGQGDGTVDTWDHREMDGSTVPLDQPFQVEHRSGFTEALMFPGDPVGSPGNVINCRCSVVYGVAD